MHTCRHCESSIDETAFCPFCGEPTGLCAERDDYEYEAFISYRHLPLSSQVAKRVQRGIEGYRVPKELRDEVGRERLGRLFRDEDELPASTSLSAQIQEALARSRFLIVICTPETRESRWVEREVELFASLHGRDRILVALAEGERSKCLPDLLLYRKTVTEDGTVASEPTEPLAADFRGASHKSRRDETLRLVAALLGCGFDDLRKRERARRRALVAKVAACVAVVVVAFLGVALSQQGQIVGQQEQLIDKERGLQVSQSRKLAKEADELLSQGDRTQAVQVALEALPQSWTSADRPYVPEARAALERAVRAFPTEDGWYPSYSRDEGSVVDLAVCDALGRYAVLDSSGRQRVYSIKDGGLVGEADLAAALDDTIALDGAESSATDGGNTIYKGGAEIWATDNGDVVVRKGEKLILAGQQPSANGSQVRWSYNASLEDLYVDCADVARDGSTIVITGNSTSWTDTYDLVKNAFIKQLDPATGKVTKTIELAKGADVPQAETLSLDSSGSRAFVSLGQDACVVDLQSGAVTRLKLAHPDCTRALWTEDGVVVSTQNNEESSPVPCAIQRFDATGGEVWRMDEKLSPFSSDGVVYEGTGDLWGQLRGFGTYSNRLVASFGGRLVTLDFENGSQQGIATLDAPVVACQVLDDEDCQRLNVCTAAGSLMYMMSNEDGVSKGSDIDTEVGAVGDASFVRFDNATHLVTTRPVDESDNDKVSVWDLFSTGQLREGADDGSGWSRPADAPVVEEGLVDATSEFGNVTMAMRVPGSNNAIVQSDGYLLLVDAQTGDLLVRSEDTYEGAHGFGFADNGRLLFAQVPIVDDYKGRSELHVFDLTCGYLAAQSVVPFGVMLSDDGSKILVDDGAMMRTPTWVMSYPTLDELLEQGRTLTE